MTTVGDEQQEYGSEGSMTGYQVEARYNSHKPAEIGGMLLDQRWKTVSFEKAHPGFGVPIGSYGASKLEEAGCYEYKSAQALRWWFHACSGNNGICLETRLVAYKIRWEIKWQRKSEHALVGGEDRSDLMPDWGKKQVTTP